MSTTYIAGRPMELTGGEWVQPGDVVDPARFPYIDAFLSSGYVYVVADESGYDRLPPHVYSAVLTRKEAEVAIKGDDGSQLDPHRKAAEKARQDDYQVALSRVQGEQHERMNRANFREAKPLDLEASPAGPISPRFETPAEVHLPVVADPQTAQPNYDEAAMPEAPGTPKPVEVVVEPDPKTPTQPEEVSLDKPVIDQVEDEIDADETDGVKEAQAFDPGEHTVKEVLAYVDAHPDQVTAIFDAETAGKNRSTLLAELTERA